MVSKKHLLPVNIAVQVLEGDVNVFSVTIHELNLQRVFSGLDLQAERLQKLLGELAEGYAYDKDDIARFFPSAPVAPGGVVA